MNGLPQPPGGFDPYGPQFQEDPNRQTQLSALPQPQTPIVPPPPDPSGQTLGTVGDLSGMNQYKQNFAQALQMTQQLIQPAKREPLPETAAPGVWANILTWGGAGIAHHQREAAYNQGVAEYNKQLELWAAETAKDMVNEQQKAQALSGESLLRQMGMGLRVKEFQMKADEAASREANRQFQQWKAQTYGAPSPSQLEAADAMGQEYVPDNGRFKLQPKQGGGWTMGPPPDPNSPAGKAVAAAGIGTGNAAETIRQHKVEDRTAVHTSSTRTMAEMAPKIQYFVEKVREDLPAAKAGAVSSRLQTGAAKLGVASAGFTRYRTNVGLLKTALLRMHVGARGGQEMMKHFTDLIDAGTASPTMMNAALDEISDYAKSMQSGTSTATTTTPGSSTTSTTMTPGTLGTPRRLSSGKLILEE